MEILVAGAGAGKTTTMAKKVIELRKECDEAKMIFCITFTNNAVDCINKKLLEHYKVMPSNIVVSTIHSFLYNVLIKPYYYLLYRKQYQKISVIALPSDAKTKKYKITRLENDNQLHQTSIPEKAKWVIYKKSSDNANIRKNRNIIKEVIKEYIGAICIDEAQDIDENMKLVIESFDSLGIPMYLMGDPKQDLRGYGCFRELIENNTDSTHYSNICYRCPQKHLLLSNRIISESEQQTTTKTSGRITLQFESDVSCEILINENNYDLSFISKKQGNFETQVHSSNTSTIDSIADEIIVAMKHNYPDKSIIIINRMSYFYAQMLMEKYQQFKDKRKAMNNTFRYEKLESYHYASIISSLPDNVEKNNNCILINSIDSIKGKEGYNCLFVLTKDLAAYLIGNKTDENKTKNRLYVALTRSLEDLTIFITSDVEKEYGKENLLSFFKNIYCK